MADRVRPPVERSVNDPDSMSVVAVYQRTGRITATGSTLVHSC